MPKETLPVGLEHVASAIEPPKGARPCGGSPTDPGCDDEAGHVFGSVMLCEDCNGHGVALHYFACPTHAPVVKSWASTLVPDRGLAFHEVLAVVHDSSVTVVEHHFPRVLY